MSRRKKLLLQKIGSLVISIAVLVALLLAVTAYQKIIDFADTNLEKAVREKLNNPIGPISRSDLLQITHLDASGKDIQSLEGIENLRRLVVLDLEDNQVNDVAPLSKLYRLTELNLRNNEITDLAAINFAALSNLPLRSLSLRHNVFRSESGSQYRLSDIKLLSEFNSLEELELRDNHISDISPLSTLTELKVLDLRENKIEDLRPLTNITSLTELNLRENKIDDLSALSGLTNLTYLNLHSNTEIKSIQPIVSLTKLRDLIMRNVFVGGQTKYLKNMSNLRRLNLRNSSITDTHILGELMSAGVLQDDPDRGIKAEIDIRDNPLSEEGFDPYFHIREFWENLSIRLPFALPTENSIKPPAFSMPGGFYENIFNLFLSSTESEYMILYTLDGSEPSINNLDQGFDTYSINYFFPDKWNKSRLKTRANKTYIYDESIMIEKASQANDLSEIITTYRNAPNIWWKPPAEDVYKGTVVRARVYDGERYSRIVTNTYFIGREDRYSLPVLSITTDGKNLFCYETGIYVPGRAYFDGGGTEELWARRGNFEQRGAEWERPAHLEYFNDHNLVFSKDVGIRIHGGGGRQQRIKALRIYARDQYDGEETINYNFFSESAPLNKRDHSIDFNRVLLRAGGDMTDHLRDVIAHDVMSGSKVGVQRSSPVIHFINGEYWGVMHFRDRLDHYHIANIYDQDIDNIILLDSPWGILLDDQKLDAGVQGDIDYYNYLYTYALENNLSLDKHYEHVKTLLCIDSYIDYHIMFIYLSNIDWHGDKHFKFWRVRDYVDEEYGDSRWRIIVWDFDQAFRRLETDLLTNAIDPDGEVEEWPFGGGIDSPKTALLRNLLENDQFRHRFINRFADHINTTFRPDRINTIINNRYSEIQDELDEHYERWGYHATTLERIDKWKNYAIKRPEIQRQHIMENFNLPGVSTITINLDTTKGSIRINTIDINRDTIGMDNNNKWTGTYFNDIPIDISAIPEPGYRFAGWDDIALKDEELTLVLENDINITAKFIKE